MGRPSIGHDADVIFDSSSRARRADCSNGGVFCAGLIAVLVGCSAGGPGAGSTTSPPSGAGGTAPSGAGGTSVIPGTGGSQKDLMLVDIGGMSSDSGGSAGGPSSQVIRTLPDGFTATDVGGYKLGARLTGNGGSAGVGSGGAAGSGGAGGAGGADAGDCGNILLGVVRDFKGANENGGHADFETDGIQGGDVTPGMVTTTLGPDQKPVYSSMCEIGHPMPAPTCPYGAQNTSKMLFDQWYNDIPGVNDAYEVSLWFAPRPGGLFTFQSLHYFPIDGAGFMSTAQADDNKPHNFGFTTELHTRFLYKGGEIFTFEGDDDVWVYINDKLAVDLGGLHPMQTRAVQLDMVATQLGIVTGTIYSLDLFHAERHTTASTFRIDTNLSFVDCGRIPRVLK
jgi:fibro-slime domain-containing protein